MSIPRDHHFIPAFYLGRWCTRDNELVEYAIKNGKLIPKWVGDHRREFQSVHRVRLIEVFHAAARQHFSDLNVGLSDEFFIGPEFLRNRNKSLHVTDVAAKLWRHSGTLAIWLSARRLLTTTSRIALLGCR